MNQAKGKQYLTEEEAADLTVVDEEKLNEAFAKATKEILLSYQVPLRRQKKE